MFSSRIRENKFVIHYSELYVPLQYIYKQRNSTNILIPEQTLNPSPTSSSPHPLKSGRY